jgi:hypothetical protein
MVELMYRSEFIEDVHLIDLELRIIEMLGQERLADSLVERRSSSSYSSSSSSSSPTIREHLDHRRPSDLLIHSLAADIIKLKLVSR